MVLLDTGTPGTSREIYNEDAEGGALSTGTKGGALSTGEDAEGGAFSTGTRSSCVQ